MNGPTRTSVTEQNSPPSHTDCEHYREGHCHHVTYCVSIPLNEPGTGTQRTALD